MLKFDEIGRWSELKLEILQQYLQAYTFILANQKENFRFDYIDAFAGAGLHISKETGEVVEGSPLIAQKAVPRFTRIDLIDLNGDRVEHLRNIFFNDDRVTVHHGNCNELLLEILSKVRFDEYRRALCLLDPYGLHLSWDAMCLAGKMGTIDLILNFPVADMNRNVFWKNHSAVDPADIDRMNQFWGDDSWKKVVWTKLPLFDDEDLLEKTGTNRTIANAFKLRLQKVAGFAHVPDPIAMKNSKGAIVYYLFFASQKDVAKKIANYIMRQAEGSN